MIDDTYERALDQWEIEERKNKALELMEEHDGIGSTIEQHQRQIRTLKLRQSTVDSRVRLLRHEVRSGKTLVDRQAELPLAYPRDERPTSPPPQPYPVPAGIDGMSDEPDPETDPIFPDELQEHDKPEVPDLFAELYPMARTMADLWTELCGWALTPEQADRLLHRPLPPAGSTGFDAIAHWSRVTKAHRVSDPRALPDGLYIPLVPPMPSELAAMLRVEKKRGARPLSSPTADLPAKPPAKKARKRRSGSTQHSD